MVQVRKLFEASLARIQIDLRDYIRGAAANEIGFANHIDSAYTEMCGAYKFRTVGWKNVNLRGFWLVLVLVLFVYFLSIERKPSDSEGRLWAEVLWDTRLGLKTLYEMTHASAPLAANGDVTNGRAGAIDGEGSSNELITENINKANDQTTAAGGTGASNESLAQNGNVRNDQTVAAEGAGSPEESSMFAVGSDVDAQSVHT